MFEYIEGKVIYKNPTYAVIDIGGIGYRIRITLNTYAAIPEGERYKLNTWVHIKEDAHTLYGFGSLFEKKIFLDLIGISGVGPGTAIMMLSSLSAEDLQNAIIGEDLRTIQGIKGIGSKTAQRIILELKDKMLKESPGTNLPLTDYSGRNRLKDEALTALVTLGIARAVADKSIENILKKEGNNLTLEELIKLALKFS